MKVYYGLRFKLLVLLLRDRVNDRIHLMHVSADPLNPHAEYGHKNDNRGESRE